MTEAPKRERTFFLIEHAQAFVRVREKAIDEGPSKRRPCTLTSVVPSAGDLRFEFIDSSSRRRDCGSRFDRALAHGWREPANPLELCPVCVGICSRGRAGNDRGVLGGNCRCNALFAHHDGVLCSIRLSFIVARIPIEVGVLGQTRREARLELVGNANVDRRMKYAVTANRKEHLVLCALCFFVRATHRSSSPSVVDPGTTPARG